MRVLVDATMLDGLPSGAATRLAALGARCAARDDVELVHLVRPGVDPLPGLRCVPCAGLHTPWRRARGGRLLAALAREHGADLLALGALPLPRVRGVPMVLTLHDLRFLRAAPGVSLARRLWARALLARNLSRASALVAVSRTTAEGLRARLGERAPPLHVVPNARTPGLARVDDPNRLAAFRRRAGLNARFALMVGPLAPHKGVGLALRLLAAVRRHPDASDLGLLLAGRATPDATRELARRARRLGVDHVVRVCGPLSHDELCTAYSAADALLALGADEGFCLPAVDAGALGVPVVGLRAGALPEVLGDGAWLEPPGDLPGLASALLAAVTPGDLREARLHRARALAVEKEWEPSVRALLACWRATLRPERRGGSAAEAPDDGANP